MLLFAAIPYLLLHTTAGQDSVISCGTGVYTAGMNGRVFIKLATADVSSTCPVQPSTIIFDFLPVNNSGSPESWCSAPYATCPNDNGTPTLACNNCSCGCEDNNGTHAIFYLNFTATEAHHFGTFSSDIKCFTAVVDTTSLNCDNITVDSPPETTSESPTTEKQTTQTPDSGGGSWCYDDDSDTPCIVIIVVVCGGVVSLAVLAGGVVYGPYTIEVPVDPHNHHKNDPAMLVKYANRLIDMCDSGTESDQPPRGKKLKAVEDQSRKVSFVAVIITVEGNNSVVPSSGEVRRGLDKNMHVLIKSNVINARTAKAKVEQLINEMNPGSYPGTP